MDEDGAEYQYLAGQARPGFPALLAAYDAASAGTLAARRWQLDLRYGPHPRQTFDLCPAAGPARAIVLYLHAGYWHSRDKAQFRFLAPTLCDAGFNAAVLNYPLCPDVRLAEITAAVLRAPPAVLAALPADQRQLPVVAMGHSAGGHLAVELGLAGGVAAVVALSGVFDLAPLLDTSLNARLLLDPAQARANSPLTRVHAGAPPAAFVVGGAETPAFQAQSLAMARAWTAAGRSSRSIIVPGQDHFSLLQALTMAEGRLVPLIEERLGMG